MWHVYADIGSGTTNVVFSGAISNLHAGVYYYRAAASNSVGLFYGDISGVSINCGYTASGLPIGLQIVGHRFDDLGVLQVSRAWEQMRPAQRPWPVPPGSVGARAAH